MIAVIKTGGKQYAVKSGQILKIEKIDGKKGDSISLDIVLAVSDTSSHKFGNPLIKGATVEAKILEQIRDKKIIVFKKRKRKNYRSTQGHRQHLTVLKIESIKLNGKKTYGVLDADKFDERANPYEDSASRAEEGNPSFEFQEVATPSLPPKTKFEN